MLSHVTFHLSHVSSQILILILGTTFAVLFIDENGNGFLGHHLLPQHPCLWHLSSLSWFPAKNLTWSMLNKCQGTKTGNFYFCVKSLSLKCKNVNIWTAFYHPQSWPCIGVRQRYKPKVFKTRILTLKRSISGLICILKGVGHAYMFLHNAAPKTEY